MSVTPVPKKQRQEDRRFKSRDGEMIQHSVPLQRMGAPNTQQLTPSVTPTLGDPETSSVSKSMHQTCMECTYRENSHIHKTK